MITDDQGTQILKKIDEQFKEVNTKLDHVITMAVNSQHAIKNLVTREEFEEKFEKYQEENVEFKHAIVKRLEKLEDIVVA